MSRLIGVVAYLCVLVVIGAVASSRMRNVRDFIAAGKSLSYWAAAFSARATGESAWLLLGLTGMGATAGLSAMWVVVGEIAGVSAAWLILARRFKRATDRCDALTMPDYLAARFSDRGHLVRLVSAGALVIFVTIYVSAQIDATGKAFGEFLGWNYYVGALVGFGVVIVYSVSGGFLAVVWSDIFQGMMMFLGLVSLPILGLIQAGGWEPVAEGLRGQNAALLSWMPAGEYPVLTVLSLSLIGLGFLGSPQIFVRFIAMRSESEIPRGALVAIFWTLLADTGAVLTGMVGRHLLMGPGAVVETTLGKNAEGVLPALAEHLLPALIVGLFIAVVLSAIMSTADSLLVVAASAFVRDYYQKVRAPNTPDEALVPMSRQATLVLAGTALTLALIVAAVVPGRSVFWFVIFGWSGIAATFCPTVILSLFWPRFSSAGALAAMITGFAAVPIFKFAVPAIPRIGPVIAKLEELPPAFACSFIAGIIVTLIVRPRAARSGPLLDG